MVKSYSYQIVDKNWVYNRKKKYINKKLWKWKLITILMKIALFNTTFLNHCNIFTIAVFIFLRLVFIVSLDSCAIHRLSFIYIYFFFNEGILFRYQNQQIFFPNKNYEKNDKFTIMWLFFFSYHVFVNKHMKAISSSKYCCI